MTTAKPEWKLGAPNTSQTLPRRNATRKPLLVAGGVALAVALLLHFCPTVMRIYYVARAREALEAGLRWPNPRHVDSLPTSLDDEVLERALSDLHAAMRWSPDSPQAYRLVGQVYAARKDWAKAAAAFDQARAVAPGNPLPAWESGLIYEQMADNVQAAPKDVIVRDLLSEPFKVPATAVGASFCRDGQNQTCYYGRDEWARAYAQFPDGPKVKAEVLFMHPPASVKHTRAIDANLPVLQFMIGLDPEGRMARTDGVTFQVWVEPASGAAALVYERILDPITATNGWVPGQADLAVWAGQTVTLELRTTGGPSGKTAGDWHGWGNLMLTSKEAARAAMLAPEARMWQAWRELGMNAAHFMDRGDLARGVGQYKESLPWYERAARMQPEAIESWYYAGLAYKGLRNWDKAVEAFQSTLDRAPRHRDAWYELGLAYTWLGEWAAALDAFQHGLQAGTGEVGVSNLHFRIGYSRQVSSNDLAGAWEAYRQALAADDFSGEMWNKAHTHHMRGIVLTSQGRWEEAIAEIQKAITLKPDVTPFYLSLAQVQWQVGRREHAMEIVQRAIAQNPNDKDTYRVQGDFYRLAGNQVQARAMYTKVLELDPRDVAARTELEKLGTSGSPP